MKDTHKWTKSKKLFIVINCILCLAIIVSAMLIVIDRSRIKNGVIYTDKNIEATETTAADKGTSTARLMCAGDNLIHGSIYRQANVRSENDGYDFEYAYNQIEEIIALSDIAFINQETVMDKDNEPSSYPLFNSPTELLDHMIKIGFDVFNQANNHVMDMHESGARNDIALFKSKNDIILTGLYETQEEMLIPQTKTVNGITFSFVGFTEYLNGLIVPENSSLGLLYLTDTRSTKEELYGKMKLMIEKAKQESDVVCVSMHWADEDITKPDESQEEILSKLLEYGADIVIGAGPHVLQPIEYRQNGDGEQAAVIWSLGNFISCQAKIDELLGGIADINVTKNNNTGKTTIDSVKFIPTVTMYNSGYTNVRIVPFKNFTEELAAEHGLDSGTVTKDYISNFYNEMYGDKLETEWK